MEMDWAMTVEPLPGRLAIRRRRERIALGDDSGSGGTGSVSLGISTSGNSRNVIEAPPEARR